MSTQPVGNPPSHRAGSRKNHIKAFLAITLALILSWMLSVPSGSIPAVGPLLSPATGFWQNMESGDITELQIASDRLRDEVTVVYDERHVPHIFARNDHDLYFAQGFVTARDRLWQLELQARAASGELSELVGPAAVDYDRGQRRLGIREAAEEMLELTRREPEYYNMLQAYADGVNAWIDRLPPKKYPLEYKILGSEPRKFEPLHSTLMVLNIATTLTTTSYAHAETNARALLDDELYRQLFPRRLPWVRPMVPEDHIWDFDPIPKNPPDSLFVPQIVRNLDLPGSPPGIGSNSWVVDGSRTASGHPILSSDPHLNISLPAIWYEIHLNSENINTYGMSIPNMPGVVIGFNEHVSWGITAGTSTTLDIFEIAFRDERREEYLHDGEWKPVRRKVEEIRLRDGEIVTDTVLYTHHGPVTQPFDEVIMNRQYPRGHAITWIAHQPSNIKKSLYLINRARNTGEFLEAIEHFETINLNFIYADRDGNIAGWHSGKLPVRFPDHGRFISDGRDPAYDWDVFIPFEQLPHVINPDQGYIANTNQIPYNEAYPYHLGIYYADFSRPNRVNELLEPAENITMDDFQGMLMDNHSLLMERFLTPLLPLLDTGELTGPARQMAGYLLDWDFRFDRDSRAALFANMWMEELRDALWEPIYGPFHDDGIYVMRPVNSVNAWHLNRGNHDIFPVDLEETINRTFLELIGRFTGRHGDDPEQWAYGSTRNFTAHHLSYIPGMQRDDLHIGGVPHAINAVGSVFAPSMRLLVEMGPEIRARGNFAGGQSGNPGNPRYDTHIDDWPDGILYDLKFWRSAEEASGHAVSTLTFQPKK